MKSGPGCSLLTVSVFLSWAVVSNALEEGSGHPAEAQNVRLVGTDDLQGRSAYQPFPIRQGDRTILYVGHHAGRITNPLTGNEEESGTSVVDVTDPIRPQYLRHIPASGEARGAQHVQVCAGDELPRGEPGKFYLLRTNGNDGHEIWDVTEPRSPSLLTTVARVGKNALTGERGTHKNGWDCASGIGYLIGSVDGWRATRVLQLYDLGTPATPVHLRDFSLVGVEPGSTGPVPGGTGIHEAVALGNRVYIAYGTASDGVVQIVDLSKLLEGDPKPTPENLRLPEVGRLDMPSFWGGHTAWPMLDMAIGDYTDDRDGRIRDFLVVPSESFANQCQETRHVVFMVDITDEAHPFPVSSFQVQESAGNFCDRGGRFGPHGLQGSFEPIYYKKLVLVSWFNAGLRVVDVRDPFHPREVGFYIPATTEQTEKRCVTIDGVESCKVAIQTNNVEVDDRGFIYLVDRAATGLHIVELINSAKEIVNLP